MKNFMKAIAAFAAIFVSLTLLSSCQSSPNQTDQAPKAKLVSQELNTIPQYMIDEPAPDFKLPDLNGEMTQLSALKGKIVVIHFATTWCPFCNAEAPHLEALYREYKSQGVEVFIVDVKESKALVQEKLQDRFQLTFPVLLDEDGAAATSYAPDGVLPDLARDEVVLASNLLIDREGKIRFYSLLDSQDFDAELNHLKTKLNEIL